ncbi:hypothetical protein Tco_1296066, partial [Tanacetum coccineum]
EEGYLETNPSTSPEHMFVAPDGKPNAPVDSYISGKIVQLKEQIATLEKREESIRQFLQKEYMFSAGRAVNYLVTSRGESIQSLRFLIGWSLKFFCGKSTVSFLIVMDDHHRSDGIHVTRFTLQSIYAQSEDEKLQFEYESRNINILVRC